MTNEEVQDFVTRFAAAWAARDGNAFLPQWHPDGKLYTPLVGRPVKGSELPNLLEVQKAAAPDFVWQLLDWTSRGEVVIVEWQATRNVGGRGSSGAASTSSVSRTAGSSRSASTPTPRRCVPSAPANLWSRSSRSDGADVPYLSPPAGRAKAAIGGRSLRTPKRSFGYGALARRVRGPSAYSSFRK
jgi:hypothetical protein